MINVVSYEIGAKPNKHTLAPSETYYNAKDGKYYTIGKFGELIEIGKELDLSIAYSWTGLHAFTQLIKTPRIENAAGDGVDVAGLAKIEDAGKNICTAWVAFDGTATPPTILDSFNVDSVVRTATGQFDINFTTDMDNTGYVLSGDSQNDASVSSGTIQIGLESGKALSLSKTLSQVSVESAYVNATTNRTRFNRNWNCVIIFGGKV